MLGHSDSLWSRKLSLERLSRIEQAEQFLSGTGLRLSPGAQSWKHGAIEIPEVDFARFLQSEMREQASNHFHRLDFAYVALDLQGYRTGSMNETRNMGEGETP